MKNKCEIRWCRSGKKAAIRVNENIGDGAWATYICKSCAKKLGLRDGQDLPDSSQVKKMVKQK